jgi:hypothetical protein
LKITGFIWLRDIVQKLLRKHSVTQEEVVEVFGNRPRFRFIEKGDRPAKMCMLLWGERTRDVI